MKKNFTRHGMAIVLILLFSSINGKVWAQTDSLCNTRPTYLYWVGGSSNDFFDELNWRVARQKYIYKKDGIVGVPVCRPNTNPRFILCRGDHDPATNIHPKKGTLDPGKPIANNLYVENANLIINSPLIFSCIDKGLTLNSSQVKANAGIRGTVHLENNSTLKMAGPAFENALRISLQDQNSWAYFEDIKPAAIANLPLSVWMIDLKVPASSSALLINQYYETGAVVRMEPTHYKPLSIFGSTGFNGVAGEVGVKIIFAGTSIPGGMDNNIRSFKLKRGFMATLANNTNGTGKSQVYIASEKDLEISELPASISGNVSFIRVMPWNWVTKKGTGGYFENNPLDAGWFYNWSAAETSKLEYEYVPMAWGAGATSPAGMVTITNKERTAHVLGFNESDNCDGESGQYNNLCQPDVAVAYYERLMGSGLRLGTPAPRENGPTTWLRQFAVIAKQRDVRFDFVAVHWYDWGSNPSNTPNANPQDVFNRFKAYLTQVYNEYQLPIWITEFNANPNRENHVHAAFLQLALPYLESLPYVERYAYFQPNPNNASNGVNANANYFDAGGNFTNIGVIYRDQVSRPSMPADTYVCPNNLNSLNQPLPVKQVQQFVFEAECGEYPGSKWTVGENGAASNGKFLQGNNSLAGETVQARQIHFEFTVTEENNFRFWIRSKATNGNMSVQVDHGNIDTISGVNSTDFAWQSIAKNYSFTPGKHRVSLAFINTTTQFDQIAMVAGSDDVISVVQPAGYCTPDAFVWGQSLPSAPIFAEAESAGKGASWSTGNDVDAIGGQFVTSGNLTSPNTVPDADGWLTFTVDVSAAGAYQLWAKMQSLEATSNKLWLKIDNGAFSPWTNLTQPGFVWKWKRYDAAIDGGNIQEYLFLEPGIHTFTIAYASGGVKIDRVALMPAATSPVAIDADVLAPTGPLSFEAEEAVIIGTAAIVNCATSSNGKQVNMGNAAANGLRFEKVLAATAGTYQLTLKYMLGGTNPRNLRVFVNGTQVPNQRVVPSGLWCFEPGGAPGTWVMSVRLIAGENNIELRPVSGADAPFIDKIEVRATVVSLEAELAQLTGSVTLSTCTSASNGSLASMGNTGTNAIQFNNISIPTAGTYNLNISYFSKDARTVRLFVDDQPAITLSFAISGNWCFDSPAGVTVIKTVPLTLSEGVHTIRFQPVSAANAPVLDKIDIVDPSNPEEPLITNSSSKGENGTTMLMSRVVPTESGFVYPNPAKSGTTIYVPFQNKQGTKSAKITLYDARGAAIKSNLQATSAGFKLPDVPTGIYLLRVEESGSFKTYRVMVQ